MKIEKGVPVPRGRIKYPLKEMEIGDSFFVENVRVAPMGVYNAARRYDMKITSRQEGNGYRVWRLE